MLKLSAKQWWNEVQVNEMKIKAFFLVFFPVFFCFFVDTVFLESKNTRLSVMVVLIFMLAGVDQYLKKKGKDRD